MDFEELNGRISELKAQGLDDEDILRIFYESFARGESTAEELEKMAGALGYDISDEFRAELDKEKEGGNQAPDGSGLSEEEFEETKQLDEGESPEEFKEKIEDINEEGTETASDDEGDKAEDESPEAEPEPEEEEEDEEGKAMRMFGLNR